MRVYRLAAALAVALFMLATGISAVYIAPSGQFNATENVSFNWSAGTVNVTSNYSSLVLYVDNSSTNIASSYFSASDYLTGTYAALTSEAAIRCIGAAGSQGTKFYMRNSTGDYENTTRAMNASQYATFSLGVHPDCPPGKYYGNFSVRNLTNSSDYTSVTATLNVPISESNTLDGNKTAFFKGTVASAGYHSYYVWTNATANVTSVTINLTGLTADVDLFLLDSQGRLLNKSLSLDTANESIEWAKLPSTADVWEIRIGNATSSYRGYVHYSTLNSSLSALNFGVLGANQTSSTSTYSLTNLANLSAAGVNQSAELYRIQEWKSASSSGDFSVIVPAFAQKVMVRIEWNNETGKNMTDWDLYLRDANGALLASSVNKSMQAIGSNVTAEETVAYTSSISESNDGLWNISVTNATSTGTLCSYNVTVQVWMNASQWIFTNFTQSTTFNASGYANASYAVTANVTVPRWNLTGGSYKGALRYYNGSGWIYAVPLHFNVSAGTLLVNGNLSASAYRLEDNIGINRTGANLLQVTIPVNNTGAYAVAFTGSTSGSLINGVYATRYMNITSATFPTSPLGTGANGTVTLAISINTTETANTQDIYRGWVFFNTTNAAPNSSSYPYETHNMTLEINLSNSLKVNVTGVAPGQVLNLTSPNITVTVAVRLMNGTVISNTGTMGSSNFTSATLTERNVTTYFNSTTTIGNAGVETCGGGVCSVNATLPSNMIGGNYTVALTALYNTGGANLTGSGSYSSVLINNTGLRITSEAGDSLGEVGEGNTMYANFTVTNYGMRNATNAHIIFNKGSDCTLTVTTQNSGCSSSTSGATFTSSIPGNGSQCWYRWKIVAGNVSGTTTCGGLSVTIADYATFSNATSLSLQVNNIESTASSSNPGMSGSSCATSANCVWNYRCISGSCTLIQCSDTEKHIVDHECIAYVDKLEIKEHTNLSAALGSYTKTTIMVKDTGDRSVKAKLNVTLPDGLSATVSPADCPLTSGAYCYFTINFTVSGTAPIGKKKCFYTAYSANKTSVNTAQEFYFDILATEGKKKEIDSLYAAYATQLKDELSRLSTLRLAGLSADNASKVELLLNQTQDLINAAKAAIDGGNYAVAESSLTEANATFRRVTSLLESMGVAGIASNILGIPPGTWLIIAIAGAAVIAAAVIIYMLLPPKGYSTAYKAYVKPEGPGMGQKLKRTIQKGLKKFKKDEKYTYKYRPT